MTKEEILEGNRLIAEFLGYIYVPYTAGHFGGTHGWVLKNYKLIDKQMPKLFLGRTTKDLLYHKSWDWLIPVYTRINKYITERSTTDIKFATDTDQLHLNLWISIEDYSETPIALWKSIVEYIKWYNEECSK